MEYISSVNKYTIKQIFKDNWDRFYDKHLNNIPEYVVKEVEKMLNCRNPDKLGYHKYICLNHPNQSVVVPHSCKSRFCNVCGKIATDNWIESAYQGFPDAPYYHITFTISDLLRNLFFLRRELLNVLFQSAKEVVIEWAREHKFLPAVTCVLHTFGKDLKFNPHIHMIVSAGGLDLRKQDKWVDYEFFPYQMLQKRWSAVLLGYLKQYLDYNLKEYLYSINWYVNVGLKLCNSRTTCSYIGRYTKRPVLAQTRITDYDDKRVTFFYEDRNENNGPVYLTLPVEQFISLLIQHIPCSGFRIIRHYGLLASRVKGKLLQIVFKLLNQVKRIIHHLDWRMRQLRYRLVDPLICKICGQEMVLSEVAYPDELDGLITKSF